MKNLSSIGERRFFLLKNWFSVSAAQLWSGEKFQCFESGSLNLFDLNFEFANEFLHRWFGCPDPIQRIGPQITSWTRFQPAAHWGRVRGDNRVAADNEAPRKEKPRLRFNPNLSRPMDFQFLSSAEHTTIVNP